MKAPVAAVAPAVATSEEKAISPAPAEVDVLVSPFNSVLTILEQKQKYLESRVEKLQKMENEAKHGKELPEDKKKAVLCLPDVKNQIGFFTTFQKKIVEKQREFKKKDKLRNQALAQEKEQMLASNTIDVLTARYILGQYLSTGGQHHIANSFTADERARLDVVARLFNPEFTSNKNIREAYKANVVQINAILQQNAKVLIFDGFTAADAYNTLDTLLSVVENYEEPQDEESLSTVGSTAPEDPEDSSKIVSSTPPEMFVSETRKEASYVKTQVLAIDEDKTDFSFGYVSDASSKKEDDLVSEQPASTETTGEESSTTNESSTDNEKPTAKDGEKATDSKVKRQRYPKKHYIKKTGDTVPSEENRPKPRSDRPRPNNRKTTDENSSRQNGTARGGNHSNGQRRFNGPSENGNDTGYRGHAGYRKNATNGYNRTYNNYSAGQKNGYNNGYNTGSGQTNSYAVPSGYVRQGEYVRPPPGTCGFTLQVKQ